MGWFMSSMRSSLGRNSGMIRAPKARATMARTFARRSQSFPSVAAAELSRMAETLRAEVDRFRVVIRAGNG